MSSCQDDLNLTPEQAAIQGEWVMSDSSCESYPHITVLRFTPDLVFLDFIEDGFEYTVINQTIKIPAENNYLIEKVTSDSIILSFDNPYCAFRYYKN